MCDRWKCRKLCWGSDLQFIYGRSFNTVDGCSSTETARSETARAITSPFFFLQRECSLSFDVDISVGKSVSTEMWIHGRSFATQHRYHAAKMIAAHVYTYLFHEYVCENTRARVNAELARRHVRLEISTELPMKRFHPRSRPIATMSSDVLL